MTLQENRARLSQLREWALRIASDETPAGAPSIGDIRAEMIKLEAQHRTLMAAAEEEPPSEVPVGKTSEEAELDKLLARAKMTAFMEAAGAGRMPGGAELELMQATGCDRSPLPGVVVPWQMFEPMREELEAEEQHFADAASNLQAINAPFRERWIPRIFARSDAGYLGIRMPAVGVGDHAYYTLASSNKPSKPAVGVKVDSIAASATLKASKPRRYAARYTYYVEDLVRFREYESQLRMDLRNLMSIGLDREILARIIDVIDGDDLPADGTPNGVISGLEVSIRGLIHMVVDGLQRAYDVRNVKLLVGPKTYRGMYFVYDSVAGSYNFDKYAMNVRMTTGLPAATNKSGTAVPSNEWVIGAGPLRVRPAYEVPVWQGVSFIRDHVTAADQGIVALTATMLYQFVTIDKAGLAYGQAQHTAS